jgi:hypothetical protein
MEKLSLFFSLYLTSKEEKRREETRTDEKRREEKEAYF